MGRMKFEVECVKKCLVEKGKVFSVRSYCLENDEVMVDGVGLCRRIKGFEVENKNELVKYVKLSGFKSIDEWWNKINDFVGNKRKWIYLVKRL